MNDFENLLDAFWRDLQRPDAWWQIGALLVCLLAARLTDRTLRRHRNNMATHVSSFGRGGLKRVSFPLLALLFVVVARLILRPWHPVNLLSIAIPLLGSLAIIRMVFFVLRHSFAWSAWLIGFERVFSLLVWSLVALHILGFSAQVIDLLEQVSFTVGKQQLNLWLVAQGAVTVVVTLLVALWLSGLIEARLVQAEGMDRNLKVVLSRVSKALLVLLAVLVGLPLVGIDLTTLSVFGGALGVGLGFGLQKIASNYVSGFIILLDRSIKLGNVIAVGTDRGQVTQITTRYTVLKGVTGVEAIVPNELLVGSVVRNESYTDHLVRVALSIQVAYSSDLERAMRIMAEAAHGQPRVLADPAPQVLLLEFAESGINLELGFWIKDPEAGTGVLRSDINLAIWHAFRAAGIEIPCPQREVRLVSGAANVLEQKPAV